MAKKKTALSGMAKPTAEDIVKASLEPGGKIARKSIPEDSGERSRLNAQLEKGLYEMFSTAAKNNGHNISGLVRKWIIEYLKEHGVIP